MKSHDKEKMISHLVRFHAAFGRTSSGSSKRVLGRQDPSDDPAERARLLNFVNLPTNMMMLDGCKKR